MTAPTLTEFLLDRINDDAMDVGSLECPCDLGMGGGHAAICPDRILAECDAKRRIVGWFACEDGGPDPDVAAVLEDVSLFLAAAYSDHPDYRQEWKP